jgi:hypothetical protein
VISFWIADLPNRRTIEIIGYFGFVLPKMALMRLFGVLQMQYNYCELYIPIGSVHRLANPGKIPLELIEVQVGSYLGEDIVRMADVYGRVV